MAYNRTICLEGYLNDFSIQYSSIMSFSGYMNLNN